MTIGLATAPVAPLTLDDTSLDELSEPSWLEVALRRLQDEDGSRVPQAAIATFNAAF